MPPYAYELVGGHPALDFLNTIHDWTEPEPRDYLADYGDALRFGEAAGLVTHAEARRLSARLSAPELRRLRELRTRLERVFRAVVNARAPGEADLDALAADGARAAGAARLRTVKGRVMRLVSANDAGAATLRWRIVDSAVELLTSPSAERDRLKACPSCGWFFLDETKSGTRRWCSMATCGSLAKSRRYYWRTKRRSPP